MTLELSLHELRRCHFLPHRYRPLSLLAAEALKKTAAALGHQLKVRAQDSIGAKNVLTERDIANTDDPILATGHTMDALALRGTAILRRGRARRSATPAPCSAAAERVGAGDCPAVP